MTVRKNIESYVVSGTPPVRRRTSLHLLRASVLRRGSYAHGTATVDSWFSGTTSSRFFIALRYNSRGRLDVVTLRGAHVPSREVHRSYAGLAAMAVSESHQFPVKAGTLRIGNQPMSE
jgi:hypothetical protein